MMGMRYKLTCTNEECKYCATLLQGGGIYYFDVVKSIEEEILNGKRAAPEKIVELVRLGNHFNSVASYLCPVCREFRSDCSFFIREKIHNSPSVMNDVYKMHYLDGKPKCPKCNSELVYIENPKSQKTNCPKCGHSSMQTKVVSFFD